MTTGRAASIRMYHVGFGDCFLLRVPARDRDRLVLIDCGVHSASKGGVPLPEVVGDIIDTARSITGRPMLDVVVATHRHRDHVHGFRDERWRDVEVGEVWLPWTEDPDDADARRILDKQSKRARLLLTLAASSTGTYWDAVRAISENNDGYRNGQAMAMLHGGFAGPATPRYLPGPRDAPDATRFTTALLPGVTVDVLGPQRSEETIRDLDPPDQESYFRLGAGPEVTATGRPLPFDTWAVDERRYLAAYRHIDLKPGDIGAVVNAGNDDVLGVAVALEKAVNGTSLMLLFRLGELSLLFAGDAQWGTWDAVLGDPARRQLLENTTLYKVGHHGSHNATPRRFVEDVPRTRTIAFVPVAPTDIGSWSEIPRKPLLAALGEHGAYVVRSDRWAELRAEQARRTGDPVLEGISVHEEGRWIEATLPLEGWGEG